MDKIKTIIDVVIPCYNVEETIEDCIMINIIINHKQKNSNFNNTFSTKLWDLTSENRCDKDKVRFSDGRSELTQGSVL